MKTFCSYYNQGICRSCDLLTFDYSTQLEIKEKTLLTSLEGLRIPDFEKSVTSDTTHFRNKAKFAVTGTIENPTIGLWGHDHLDEGRELLNCPLHLQVINDLLPDLKKFITTCQLSPYEISSRKGELKGIIVFHSEESQETYLRFILRSKEAVTRIKKHSPILLNQQTHLKCFSINIQPIPHAILEGKEEIFITENQSIHYLSNDGTYTLDPNSFVQTNQKVAKVLYETASRWIKEVKAKKFLELFSGQGGFSFFAEKNIESGLGIEINPHAVDKANQTAKKLNLSKLQFKCADASLIENEISSFNPDIVLVNPPRRGLAEACEILLKSNPEFIIYSSCHYQTLANDLKKLSISYTIDKIQLFDMFPHSKHFETLIRLRRFTPKVDET